MKVLARIPAWRWWVLSCFFARLPVTMAVVALVLSGRRLGSFSQGAALAGAASLASGFGAWWRARVMDRRELRGALARDLRLTACGYGVVAVLVLVRAPILVVGAGVMVTSVASSALFPGYRSMLRSVLGDDLLPAGYAVDAVLIEVTFVCGPALAGAIALLAGPMGALFAMAGFAVVAVLVGRRLPRRPPAPAGATPAPPPWSDPEILANYAGTFAVGVAIGLLEAGFAPLSTSLGHREGLGGVFSGVYAFGSGAGGLVFATRAASREGHVRRALVLLAVMGVLLLPLAVAPSLPVLLVCLVVAGLPFATCNAASSTHLQGRSHAARATETFALATTAIFLGVAAGNGGASLLLRSGSVRAIYVAAAVPPVVAAAGIALWATARRGRRTVATV
jgi:hypothetical protein